MLLVLTTSLLSPIYNHISKIFVLVNKKESSKRTAKENDLERGALNLIHRNLRRAKDYVIYWNH